MLNGTYPEGNSAQANADPARSLAKINDILFGAYGGVGSNGQVVLPSASISATGTRVDSGVNVASAVLKASAGTLRTLYGYNSGSAGYILIFDSATVPADGNTTGRGFAIPATGNFSLDVNTPYANGISMCVSSTYVNKTIAAGSLTFVATVI